MSTYSTISRNEALEKYRPQIVLSTKIKKIYRGFKNMIRHGFQYNDIVIFDPTNFKRTSLGASSGDSGRVKDSISNLYSLFLSEIDPNWKTWPPRNKSLICSFSYKYAKGYYSYTYPHIIIPFDPNETIAICPTDDIWFSFRYPLRYFTQYMIMFFEYVLQDIGGIKLDSSYFEFFNKEKTLKLFEIIDQIVSENKQLVKKFLDKNTDISSETTFKNLLINKGVIEALSYFFDLKDNGFAKMPYRLLNEYTPTLDSECWFSGKALCIPFEEYNVITEKII